MYNRWSRSVLFSALLIVTPYRMIGYDDVACVDTTSYFGQANDSVPFWMDGILCTGSEEALDDCSFSGWGIHSCDHSVNDAGIVCANSRFLPTCIHLHDGSNCVVNYAMVGINSMHWSYNINELTHKKLHVGAPVLAAREVCMYMYTTY